MIYLWIMKLTECNKGDMNNDNEENYLSDRYKL